MKKEFKITINVIMDEEAALFLGDRLTGMFQDTDLPELIGTDFDAVMTYADGRKLFPADEDYYDTDLPEVEDGPIDVASVFLQLKVADLLSNDVDSGTIKVSKDIFDDFSQGALVDIEFIDDRPKVIHTYRMFSEDADGITMVYLDTGMYLKFQPFPLFSIYKTLYKS